MAARTPWYVWLVLVCDQPDEARCSMEIASLACLQSVLLQYPCISAYGYRIVLFRSISSKPDGDKGITFLGDLMALPSALAFLEENGHSLFNHILSSELYAYYILRKMEKEVRTDSISTAACLRLPRLLQGHSKQSHSTMVARFGMTLTSSCAYPAMANKSRRQGRWLVHLCAGPQHSAAIEKLLLPGIPKKASNHELVIKMAKSFITFLTQGNQVKY
ncbi:hypothetical protein SELMODRAFT_423115 [Selaginella moellendorffii]|uniref:Uncharacterized protein n=1 Tax=Selaginella moellendorffii TaxID=88036 RepID=D8SKL9_SELML|nr:hypothetical protein SELMODRAFT_423115 [Selaginella moellendorffii]